MAAASSGSIFHGGGFDLLPSDVTEFSSLADVRSKRKRHADNTISKQIQFIGGDSSIPRFVVIKPVDPNHPIPVNPFKIGSDIDKMAGDKVLEVTRMRSGDVLVKAKSENQAKKILKFNQLPISKTHVVIEEHATLNSSRGKIYRYDFRYLTDDEILDGLKDQRVTAIYRQKRRKEGSNDLEDSGVYVLTFDSMALPPFVTIGYSRTKVSPYFPNPLRCGTCLQYGHSQKRCQRSKLCARCGEEFHEKCEKVFRCINCTRAGSTGDLNHSAISRDCPIFKREFELQKIKIIHGVSTKDAQKILANQPKTQFESFAKALKSKPCGCACSCGNKNSTKSPRPAAAATSTSAELTSSSQSKFMTQPKNQPVNKTVNQPTNQSSPTFNKASANTEEQEVPLPIDVDSDNEPPFKGFEGPNQQPQNTKNKLNPMIILTNINSDLQSDADSQMN